MAKKCKLNWKEVLDSRDKDRHVIINTAFRQGHVVKLHPDPGMS